jgi:hypothetical protein
VQFFERLWKWWKKLIDPAEKARREERKKAKELAELLERNQQVNGEGR